MFLHQEWFYLWFSPNASHSITLECQTQITKNFNQIKKKLSSGNLSNHKLTLPTILKNFLRECLIITKITDGKSTKSKTVIGWMESLSQKRRLRNKWNKDAFSSRNRLILICSQRRCKQCQRKVPLEVILRVVLKEELRVDTEAQILVRSKKQLTLLKEQFQTSINSFPSGIQTHLRNQFSTYYMTKTIKPKHTLASTK